MRPEFSYLGLSWFSGTQDTFKDDYVYLEKNLPSSSGLGQTLTTLDRYASVSQRVPSLEHVTDLQGGSSPSFLT